MLAIARTGPRRFRERAPADLKTTELGEAAHSPLRVAVEGQQLPHAWVVSEHQKGSARLKVQPRHCTVRGTALDV